MGKERLKNWKDEVQGRIQELKEKRKCLEDQEKDCLMKEYIIEMTFSRMAQKFGEFDVPSFQEKYLEPVRKKLEEVDQSLKDMKEHNRALAYLETLMEVIDVQIRK